MSRDHLHVPSGSFSPSHRPRFRANSPLAEEEGLGPRFSFDSTQVPSLLDIDIRNGIRSHTTNPSAASAATAATAAVRMSAEEQLAKMAELNAAQQKQMDAANAFANRQAEQLMESQRQLNLAQQHIQKLSDAFESLSTQQQQQPPPLTLTTAPKRKPELPPFDSKNILIWIRRIEAAYQRVGVIEAKDKFAWLESMFQVKLNPTIDAFLYGTNTENDWSSFIQYLKDEYGPTTKQKALKLMGETQRHDIKPSQFLKQLEEDTKDVKVDDIRKEHLLRTIPPRIREIMGKEVEKMSAAEVAKMADDFFDRQGKPIEKASNFINSISNSSSASSNASSASHNSSSITLPSSSSFTAAYSDDDDTDVNFVRRNGGRGNQQQRSRSRNPRGNSRSNFNRNSSNASSTGQQQQQQSQHSHPPGTCRFHRRFGDKSNKCVTDCPRYKSFLASQSGNGKGGRRQ